MYLIAKGKIKIASKQYTSIDNDYEMTFNDDTIIEPCDEENDNNLPRINVNLIPLSELLNKNANDIVGKFCTSLLLNLILNDYLNNRRDWYC